MTALFSPSASAWSATLVAAVMGFAVRASVLLLGALAATHLLRRASAAQRHTVWTVTIIGVLLLPLLGATLPRWKIALLPAPIAAMSVSRLFAPRVEAPTLKPAPPTWSASRTADVPQVVSPQPSIPQPGSTRSERAVVAWWSSMSATSAYAALWLVCTLSLLLRLAVASVRVSGWKRRSRAVEALHMVALVRRLCRKFEIERPVVLLESDQTDVPVTWGVLYPVVLLPEDAWAWDEERLTAVLTHELAHVKRFDALTQLLAQVTLAALWFHPLVWLAVRRMRLEREHACDDFVLVTGARASRYADELLGFARALIRPTAPAAAALAMARRSELEGRLLAILDPAVRRGTMRRARVTLLTAATVFLAIPLAAFRVVAEERATTRVAPISAETRELSTVADPRTTRPRLPAAPVTTTLPAPPSVVLAPRDTDPRTDLDLETLVEVTKAAQRMTSDTEKGQLLALIARRYQRSDALRDAYLAAVMTMTSDDERGKALIALLDRDSLPLNAVATVLDATAAMTSDADKGMVLQKIAPAAYADTAVQRAYLDAIVGMSSDTERGGALAALLRRRTLTPGMQLALLDAILPITSDNEKANALMLFIDNQTMQDSRVRRAFIAAAGTLTSDSDYRRVISAIMK